MKNIIFYISIIGLFFTNSFASCSWIDSSSNDNKPGTVISNINNVTTNKSVCVDGESPNGDADYYHFKVGTAGTLKITTSSPNNHKYHLMIGSTAGGDEYYPNQKAISHNVGTISLNKNDNIYIYVKETGSDTDKYRLNFDFTKSSSSSGSSSSSSSGGNSTSSSTQGICYALDDTQSMLYKVHMNPGASPLPVAQKINLQGKTESLNGEAEAFNSKDGLIYGFHENNPPTLYSINPSNGQVKKVKTLTYMKKNVTGASFYNGYFYVIAERTLYKINTSNWSLISQKDINGATTHGDALAINKNGNAYVIDDDPGKIYSINLNTAKTSYVTQIHVNTDAEALSFAKDGNLYTENSEDGISNDTDKLFKVDLSSGQITASAQIPHSDDIDIEGLSCNTQAASAGNTPPPPPPSTNHTAVCPSGYTLDTSINYIENGDFHILDERTAQPSNVPPSSWLSQGTWKSDAIYQGNDRYPQDGVSSNDTTSSIIKHDIVYNDIAGFTFSGNSKYSMGSQNSLYSNGNDLGHTMTVWESKKTNIDSNSKYIFVAHFSNALYKNIYPSAANPKVRLSYKDSYWHNLGSPFEVPRDNSTYDKSKNSDKWYEISYLISPSSSNIYLKIEDSAYEKGNFGDDLVVGGLGLFKCKPNTPSTTPNAMLLTRGDGNNNDKTNVYVFYVDTDTDTIKDFHLLKKLNKKFRSLSYHDGKFWTADMSGNLYTIDINTGNYTLNNTYGKIDSNVMSLDFDENNNIYYNIRSSSDAEHRKLRKYNPSSGSSTTITSVPSSDSYIDDGIAYYGNNKLVVSVGSGAVRFIENGNIGQHISSSEWCVYGGEYVGNNKSYFINAESNDLSIYKLDGTSWSKFYDYGSHTGGLKGMAIAISHTLPSTPPAPPTPITAFVSNAQIVEGNSGQKSLDFNIELSSPAPSGGITISYSTQDGSAKTSNRDYKSSSGSITIPSGQTKATISITIYGDNKVESDESFKLNLTSTNNINFVKR